MLWICAVAAGWAWIAEHDFSINTATSNKIVDHWPASSDLLRGEQHSTLVLFLHPKCPCSRASLHELGELLDSRSVTTAEMPNLVVDVTLPKSTDESWDDTDNISTAKQLTGARVFLDRGGVEAARFGATTSGQVMLFDTAGNRLYAGGITESRGHQGDNAARDCLEQLLHGNNRVAHEMPTFGCRLCLPDDQSDNAVRRTAAN